MAKAAMAGLGIALAPAAMFEAELRAGALVRPFSMGIATGSYWLTRLKSRDERPAMQQFRAWIVDACAEVDA